MLSAIVWRVPQCLPSATPSTFQLCPKFSEISISVLADRLRIAVVTAQAAEVIKMKQINANTLRSVSETTRRIGSTGKAAKALVAALLITAVGITGCSKKNKEVAVNSVGQNNSTQGVSVAVAPAPNTTSTATVSEPAKVKRVVKKHPSTVTYNDGNHGISFQYPRKYTLKTGEKAKLNSDGIEFPVNFVQPGGVTIAAVEMPSNSYLGTDFYSAFLSVSVNRNLTSVQCEMFAQPVSQTEESKVITPEQSDAAPQSSANGENMSPIKVSIHGTDFSQVEKTIEKTDTKYFHTFQNGACYEFALGLQTAEPIDGIDPVNRDEVFAKLEKILATVKIKSDGGSEVAASTEAHPSSGENH